MIALKLAAADRNNYMYKKHFGQKGSHGRGRDNFKKGFSHGGGRGRGHFGRQRIDVSRFIKKVTVTEEVFDYTPEHSFTSFKIHEKLKQNILAKGYVLPTPIQDKAIPHILEGKDIVGLAQTGTGKTAAFLLPLINKILHKPATEQVLIIAPTRELATQINDEFMGFARGLGLFSVVCIGGANIWHQISSLRRKHHVVIGTPGRLKDLIERKALLLGDVGNIVLDEADRMLDMGFIADITYLLSKAAPERQTLLFSATLSPEIERIIKNFQRNPIKISVKTQDTSANVEQDIIRVKPGEKKVDLLHDLLIKKDFSKVLVFGRTKHGVEKLSHLLAERGFKVASIHGDKTHGNRQRALRQFKENQVQILVATDVAARGLDIPNVTHVINFDIPGTYEDYVHRIGRTGRANKKGFALTFVE
jgi:ATP-dependent RNA helicase RhlE